VEAHTAYDPAPAPFCLRLQFDADGALQNAGVLQRLYGNRAIADIIEDDWAAAQYEEVVPARGQLAGRLEPCQFRSNDALNIAVPEQACQAIQAWLPLLIFNRYVLGAIVSEN
jgi:hypothetical protein